ncbi:MAG TPA: EAL domain-containing protein [Steroidobacteraceae bacterium]|nr:EAL domain-containing protein [Steroidobacteraceae bacterium]
MITDSSDIVNRRILVVDDNAAIHEDFQKILGDDSQAQSASDLTLSAAESLLFGGNTAVTTRPTFQIDCALQGQQGVHCAEKAVANGRPYAMAFVDMRMPPGWDGLETIERLWAVDSDLQVVICSAHSDYDWSDVIERLGHSDQLLVLKKPFEPIEVLQCASALTRKWQHEQKLRRHVESLERTILLRTEGLETANRQLRHLATHDALTGLPNRILLDDRLAQAIAHADRDDQQFAVLVLDLDRFKVINDSFGHHAGDELLNEVARRLSSLVRNIDTVARVGGDEFVLVLGPASERAAAKQIGQLAMTALQAPVRISGVDIHVSPSIGIAFYPADATTAGSLIARADAAMYCAKQQGRGNLQCFEPGMDTTTRERVQLESDLHHALKLRQFEVFYQPKADAASGILHSAEALIRWRHPERGLVLPAQFIPLAEECGLINSIGEWVLREACRQCKTWQRDGLPPLRVAVNVAASQFRQSHLVEIVRRALDDANLEARYLELELTESAVMTNPEESAAILEQLSRMGVLVSVDDFGTGYSSMSYLRRFPIDKLKIDRSFIKELTTRAEDASIVQAIISLAHGLQLKVVAEGVETAEQLEFLKSLGCDQYQGFHYSKPLPAAAFSELVRDQQQAEDRLSDEIAASTHSKLAAYR